MDRREQKIIYSAIAIVFVFAIVTIPYLASFTSSVLAMRHIHISLQNQPLVAEEAEQVKAEIFHKNNNNQEEVMKKKKEQKKSSNPNVKVAVFGTDEQKYKPELKDIDEERLIKRMDTEKELFGEVEAEYYEDNNARYENE